MPEARCPDRNNACDGSDLLHGDWCQARSAATSDGWTPELRRLEREYDEARHAAHAAHDGFEEGLIRVAQEAWERFSTAVRNGR